MGCGSQSCSFSLTFALLCTILSFVYPAHAYIVGMYHVLSCSRGGFRRLACIVGYCALLVQQFKMEACAARDLRVKALTLDWHQVNFLTLEAVVWNVQVQFDS